MQILIIAGPNGTGKPTLVEKILAANIEYINPNVTVKKLVIIQK
jgi:predicted ABC-type ATPase